MAELTYPFYQLVAGGPNETGFTVTVQIQEGAGGPLPGQTPDSVLAGLRQQLEGGDAQITTTLAKVATTTMYL